MPIFFQQQINDETRLGIWKIEEGEEFFKGNVPLHRDVTHPRKRLQHLAGRFLLQFLFPGFPYELIRIADTRKPFLPEEQFHFSISHCGDFAAAIVSKNSRVGVDIEMPLEKLSRIREKFLNADELSHFPSTDPTMLALLWSCKEAVFKWYGVGGVDFRQDIHLSPPSGQTVDCSFTKENMGLLIHYLQFEQIALTWVVTEIESYASVSSSSLPDSSRLRST